LTSTSFEQRDQPEGVPPLELTGERTLPDVPEENYWFRRHLVVYEWIAARVGGLRVIDMACGEGYGSDVLAGAAASVVGVDANPQAHDHARLRYQRPNLRFERDLVDTFAEPADAVVFLQTIEHLQDPGATLAHFRALVREGDQGAGDEGAGDGGGDEGAGDGGGDESAGDGRGDESAGDGSSAGAAKPSRGGTVFVSTPNVLTLAPKGASRSGNPWHVHEYRAEEFARLCEGHFSDVQMYGLFHARKLRAHELALRAGWDAVHARLGLTKRFYDWFTPAISVADFAVRPAAEASLDGALDFLAVCRV
jgi:hypothetical protein